MLFQYIGPDAAAPATCEIYDHFFVLNGEPVEVTNAHSIKKLMGNMSFKFEPALIAPVTPVAHAITAPAEITDEGDILADLPQAPEPKLEVVARAVGNAGKHLPPSKKSRR